MGRDKATIAVDASGATLAQRLATALGTVADPVVEVGDGATELRAVREAPPGSGPLAAIGAGWAALDPAPEAVLVVACDMPNVDEQFLRWLADHAADGSVVPVAGRHPQPLCARWTASAMATIPDLLASGERSLRSLLAQDDVTLAPEVEWRRVGGAGALADIDTPADLRRLLPDAPAAP